MSTRSYHRSKLLVFVHVLTQPEAPAHAIAQYEIQRLDLTATKLTPFFGEPRPELDEAWSELTECTSY